MRRRQPVAGTLRRTTHAKVQTSSTTLETRTAERRTRRRRGLRRDRTLRSADCERRPLCVTNLPNTHNTELIRCNLDITTKLIVSDFWGWRSLRQRRMRVASAAKSLSPPRPSRTDACRTRARPWWAVTFIPMPHAQDSF